MLSILSALYPDEWENLRERIDMEVGGFGGLERRGSNVGNVARANIKDRRLTVEQDSRRETLDAAVHLGLREGEEAAVGPAGGGGGVSELEQESEVRRWAADRQQALSRTVRGVMLYGDALRVLARCGMLQHLALRSAHITDGTVLGVTRCCPDLAVLSLAHCTRITAAALAHLRRLRQLRSLDLRGCALGSDAAAAAWCGTQLEALDLGECAFDARGGERRCCAREGKPALLRDGALRTALGPRLLRLSLAGALHLSDDGVGAALDAAPALEQLDGVKFLARFVPGETIELALRRAEGGRKLTFEIRRGDTRCTTGRLTFAAPLPPWDAPEAPAR